MIGKFSLLIVLFFCSFLKAQKVDSTKFKLRNFELSFGQSLLFISNSKQTDIINNEAIVLPTSAILFSAEFRPDKLIRVPIFFNLATESKQFLVNGQLVNEKASPTLGTGVLFKAFQIKIDNKSKIEFEIGPLTSFLFDTKKSIRVAPIIAGRIKILRGENFVMYLGTSYSFGINAIGLLYGTGTSF
jgi:hypothetical protein